MKGLIYKDIVTMRKQASTYLIFLIVYGGLCVAGVFPISILTALVAVIGLTIPMSSVATDDMTHWDRYAASTPVSRLGIVGGKYLFALLVIGATAIVTAAVFLLLSLLHLTEDSLLDLAAMVATCFFLTLLLNAITLPLLLKYGAERARVISTALFVLIFGGSVLLGGLAARGISLPAPSPRLAAALPVAFALFCTGAFLLSFAVSLGIYRKKEF